MDNLQQAPCVGRSAFDAEAGVGDRAGRFAVEMTLSLQREPYRVEGVGHQARQPCLTPNMFQQEKMAAGSQHSPNLGQRRAWIVDAAKDKRPDGRVKGLVRER